MEQCIVTCKHAYIAMHNCGTVAYKNVTFLQVYLFPSEAIQQRILLHYISVIVWVITKLLCGKVLSNTIIY